MASTTESGPSGQSGVKAPAVYHRFDGQYIDGSWRPGKQGGVRVDTDPYSGATLAETVLANQRDLDQAYHAAAKAQVSWADRLPLNRKRCVRAVSAFTLSAEAWIKANTNYESGVSSSIRARPFLHIFRLIHTAFARLRPFELTKRFICTLDASRELHCLGAGLTIDAHVAILAKEHEIFVIAPCSRVLSRTTGCGGWQVAS